MARAKSKTPILQLDAAQTQDAVLAIKRFMEDRFELELGSFEAEELLDFFAREFAPYFYNKRHPRRAVVPEGTVRKHRERCLGAGKELSFRAPVHRIQT